MPVIRAATLDDVPALLLIEQKAASAAHWTHEQYERRVVEGLILVAEEVAGEEPQEPGSIRGFVCARVVAGEWEIENIVVTEEMRRRGIADELLREFVRRARTQNATAVWLEVRESNVPARRLYEKHGFHESGRRRGYYGNPAEDAMVYVFRLT